MYDSVRDALDLSANICVRYLSKKDIDRRTINMKRINISLTFISCLNI